MPSADARSVASLKQAKTPTEPARPQPAQGQLPRSVFGGDLVAAAVGNAAVAAPAERAKAKPAKATPAKAKTAKSKPAKSKAAKAKTAKAKTSKAKSAKSKPAKAKAKAAKAVQKPKPKAKRPLLTAASADPMELYQRAVQSPETDAAFLAKTFKQLRGRHARHLREDFCGTAYLLAAWLARHKDNTAEGFDIDPEPVAWGLAHNFAGLEDAAERASIHLKDVREPSHRRPEIRTAPNFSWMIFTERPQMLEYFRRVHADLVEDGLFVLDIYGGPEAMEEMEEVRKVEGGFTYVWDQKAYEPATGAYHCRIHFRFKDGSELRNVFDYHWRLWTLPEVVDLLREAGFSRVDSWWEGTDEDGVSGDGIFRRHAKGENCPAWVTYIVAQR